MSPQGQNSWRQPMYIRSGNPETENEATLHYPGMLGGTCEVVQPFAGAAGVEEHRNKRYQLIKTDSTMTVAPFRGAVAWWANQQQYLVTTDPATLGRARVAGVFQNAITRGNYGFIQKKGPATVKFIDAPTAAPSVAGGNVIPSATAGKADNIAAGTSTGWPVIGQTVSVLAGGTSEAVVELDIPELL